MDIAVFKNLFKIFLNESPFCTSFYYKPYIGLLVKKKLSIYLSKIEIYLEIKLFITQLIKSF